MNHDLVLIKGGLVYDWEVSFNPNPLKQAVEAIFSRKRNEMDHPMILCNSIPVKKVDEHKHLSSLLIQLFFRLTSRQVSVKYVRALVCEISFQISPYIFTKAIYHFPAKVCELSENITLPILMEKLGTVFSSL